QPTALVHEAWLRLVGGGVSHWNSRGHFFGAAAEAMGASWSKSLAGRGGCVAAPELSAFLLKDSISPRRHPRSDWSKLARRSITWPTSNRKPPRSSNCVTSLASTIRRWPKRWAFHCAQSNATGPGPRRG